MKTTFKTLLAVAAFAAFATTSCSQKTADNAEAATENAADATSNAASDAASATGEAASNAANATADAAKDAVTPDSDGQNTVAPENGDTATVRNKPADGVVDKTAKQQ